MLFYKSFSEFVSNIILLSKFNISFPLSLSFFSSLFKALRSSSTSYGSQKWVPYYVKSINKSIKFFFTLSEILILYLTNVSEDEDYDEDVKEIVAEGTKT